MREVAALAGVSLKTVSRVVNDEPGVAPAVRERVRTAVQQLDYRHHRGASDLRRRERRGGVVGVLVQDVANDFSAQLLRAIEDRARQHELVVLAASLDEDPDRERAVVSDLVARRVDGLVLVPATDRQDYLLPEQRAGLPLVFVDRAPRGIAADAVTVDNAAGTRAAVEHLLERGHRRIAYLGDLPHIATARERHEGFAQALAAAGVDDRPPAQLGVRDEVQARAAVLRLLEDPHPPTALVTGRNVLTTGALRALRERGAEHAVALVGFDDLTLFEMVDPGVSAVQQDVRTLGSTAADLLVARLRGHDGPPEHVVLQPRLVVRSSSSVPPGDRARRAVETSA
ncbi:LacI family DNA-binding transcriptional regulator [Quadrisphaera sp. KR29]|uniref:LacI family DNA-binding transcriptional regulator n=1 Tax=Quadrisphaera sp. KR29 TaxID=3461391 RepID=UPI004044DAAF